MGQVDEVTIANVEMAKAWDGEEGERWAQDADRYDSSSINFWRAFLATDPVAPGDRVVDIGCGNGKSTRDAARLAAPGAVLGVDLSAKMLDVARRRSLAEALSNVSYVQADAQVFPFDEGGFDVAISCFGAMFFDDPVAAFSNVRRALRRGGRLAILSWRTLADNPWIVAMRDALAVGRQLGAPPVSAPGPFGLADPEFVRGVLARAGFASIGLTPIDEPLDLGRDADDAYAFALRMGIVKGLTQDLDAVDRQRALDSLYAVLASNAGEGGVRFQGGVWLITAQT